MAKAAHEEAAKHHENAAKSHRTANPLPATYLKTR